MGASWPEALTHSPTPGSKKNVGFFPRVSYPLKANPVYRSIIQVAETAVYRRMLVRIQLERLSFVGEMIYPTVELNFHKTIIC